MENEAADIADKTFTTTPRTMLMFSVAIISAYAWTLSNFVTVESFEHEIEQVAGNLKSHIDEQTIWKLETKLEDIGDKRWLVQQRLSQPGGDTSENRKQVKDLNSREKKAERSLQCVRTGGNHCISRTDG